MEVIYLQKNYSYCFVQKVITLQALCTQNPYQYKAKSKKKMPICIAKGMLLFNVRSENRGNDQEQACDYSSTKKTASKTKKLVW